MCSRPTLVWSPVLALALSLIGAAAPSTLSAQKRSQQAASASDASVTPQEGLASFYAKRRHGRRTASGERFDNRALVAAHPTLPFGTKVRVTNLGNGRAVDVRVIDRGPTAARRRDGYVIDLSRAAAEKLDFLKTGRAKVRLEVVGDRR